jgi:hypothetical protein
MTASPRPVAIERLFPCLDPPLLAKMTLRLPHGMLLHGAKLISVNGALRISMPCRFRQSADLKPRLSETGQFERSRILSFVSVEASDAWRNAVIAELWRRDPEFMARAEQSARDHQRASALLRELEIA